MSFCEGRPLSIRLVKHPQIEQLSKVSVSSNQFKNSIRLSQVPQRVSGKSLKRPRATELTLSGKPRLPPGPGVFLRLSKEIHTELINRLYVCCGC